MLHCCETVDTVGTTVTENSEIRTDGLAILRVCDMKNLPTLGFMAIPPLPRLRPQVSCDATTLKTTRRTMNELKTVKALGRCATYTEIRTTGVS